MHLLKLEALTSQVKRAREPYESPFPRLLRNDGCVVDYFSLGVACHEGAWGTGGQIGPQLYQTHITPPQTGGFSYFLMDKLTQLIFPLKMLNKIEL